MCGRSMRPVSPPSQCVDVYSHMSTPFCALSVCCGWSLEEECARPMGESKQTRCLAAAATDGGRRMFLAGVSRGVGG
eukprot:5141221-Prymnesium_polylepis.1